MKSKNKSEYRGWIRNIVIVSLALCLLLQTACTNKSRDSADQHIKLESKSLDEINQSQVEKLTLVTQNGIQYVNAKQLLDLLNFQAKWDAANSTYLIGDKDVNFVIKIDSLKAQKAGDMINLTSPPIIINQSAYLPISVLGDLFRQDMSYSVTDNILIVHGKQGVSDFSLLSVKDNSLDFGDDPNDPNKDQNSEKLIKKSLQYLGVKYIFGAQPYPVSGGFDCSSFTQYLFGKQGKKLKRLARDQAYQGNTVSRKSLRTGDLLFFNVPGRFKSNNMVGHVGIYLGKNEMINANNQPENGVQITNIDKAYWKQVFITAKRAAG
jgi:cell wall-associated NlpC family hydrolase